MAIIDKKQCLDLNLLVLHVILVVLPISQLATWVFHFTLINCYERLFVLKHS